MRGICSGESLLWQAYELRFLKVGKASDKLNPESLTRTSVEGLTQNNVKRLEKIKRKSETS